LLLGTHARGSLSVCLAHTHGPFFISLYSARDTLTGLSSIVVVVGAHSRPFSLLTLDPVHSHKSFLNLFLLLLPGALSRVSLFNSSSYHRLWYTLTAPSSSSPVHSHGLVIHSLGSGALSRILCLCIVISNPCLNSFHSETTLNNSSAHSRNSFIVVMAHLQTRSLSSSLDPTHGSFFSCQTTHVCLCIRIQMNPHSLCFHQHSPC